MGITNKNIQIKTGFFHALGKVLSLDTNFIGNESYKSAHNVRSEEVWTDDVNFAEYFTDAISEASTNDAVTQVGLSPVNMYPLANTNYQTWFLDTGSPSTYYNGFLPSENWVKPFINPSDVPNVDGSPSNGYSFRMYRNDGTTLVSYDNVFYEVDYFSGLIRFQITATPVDAANVSGMGFVMDKQAFESTPVDLVDRIAFLDDYAPKAIAFQYTGENLRDALIRISNKETARVEGSKEWKDSINGYLIKIGNGENISGETDINAQITYLNEKYEKYFIQTSDDISGVTWSGIVATNSWYQFDGTFNSYIPSDVDDENRFLVLENTLILDTVVISPTGSATETIGDTVIPNYLIEYLDPTVTGLSFSTWEVTTPRTGMFTSIDNKNSITVRYTLNNEWEEFITDFVYKVNSQKNIVPYTTTHDYDIAIPQTLEYQPFGDRTVDVLLNGLEMPTHSYAWGYTTGASVSVPVAAFGSNNLIILNAYAPTVGQYLQFDNLHRQVVDVATNSAVDKIVTYGGTTIPSATNVWKFNITVRPNKASRQGDWLLWIASNNWYQLEDGVIDILTLEYTTLDSGALNS